MRGSDTFTESLFSLKKLDDFVPEKHPLRAIRAMVNDALVELEDLFAGMYEDASKGGRPSIAPQKLLRAMLLQVLYRRSCRLAFPGLLCHLRSLACPVLLVLLCHKLYSAIFSTSCRRIDECSRVGGMTVFSDRNSRIRTN